jgi:predicted esterase
MAIPDLFGPLPGLISHAESLASSGSIDSLSNIANSSVYVFHGTADYTVRPNNGEKVEQMYKHFGARVSTSFGMNANHGFVSER